MRLVAIGERNPPDRAWSHSAGQSREALARYRTGKIV
ncbi:hypothetical protein AvCA_34820 [Azotobacter vinelandii CA]|uniref:Uncharacterized protein n=2 Tax=Azotobacter vinelandii TaxID=354 RepID=C1DQJ5_AZOVD|nr:hypothetical protein Avin_34820 [Azotobacter vinelandii DJ]AGK14628.1 hypothetical protein AvCA_34820 [Azotobacter vinelandii CA]AGK21372.1 hypothetical protein AvCA6_34820 [Azotobacter vinelandii CA6]